MTAKVVSDARELTGIQVTVKVNDRDGAVGTVDGSQQGERDGVVAAERDDPRQRLALNGRTPLVRICRRGARENPMMAVLDLLKSPSVVVPS